MFFCLFDEMFTGYVSELNTDLANNASKAISTFVTGSTLLTSGYDLNNATRGTYYSPSRAVSESITHRPSEVGTAFRLFVFDIGYEVDMYLFQIIISANGMYFRMQSSTTWGSWYRVALTAVT